MYVLFRTEFRNLIPDLKSGLWLKFQFITLFCRLVRFSSTIQTLQSSCFRTCSWKHVAWNGRSEFQRAVVPVEVANSGAKKSRVHHPRAGKDVTKWHGQLIIQLNSLRTIWLFVLVDFWLSLGYLKWALILILFCTCAKSFENTSIVIAKFNRYSFWGKVEVYFCWSVFIVICCF